MKTFGPVILLAMTGLAVTSAFPSLLLSLMERNWKLGNVGHRRSDDNPCGEVFDTSKCICQINSNGTFVAVCKQTKSTNSTFGDGIGLLQQVMETVNSVASLTINVMKRVGLDLTPMTKVVTGLFNNTSASGSRVSKEAAKLTMNKNFQGIVDDTEDVIETASEAAAASLTTTQQEQTRGPESSVAITSQNPITVASRHVVPDASQGQFANSPEVFQMQTVSGRRYADQYQSEEAREKFQVQAIPDPLFTDESEDGKLANNFQFQAMTMPASGRGNARSDAYTNWYYESREQPQRRSRQSYRNVPHQMFGFVPLADMQAVGFLPRSGRRVANN